MLQNYVWLLFMINEYYFEASGSRIGYTSAYGLSYTDPAVYTLWNIPITSVTPQADCGMMCYTDTKCVSYSVNINDETCKGYSQTLLEASSTGSGVDPSSQQYFYSDRCGNPSSHLKADIIDGNVKDRYICRETLKMRCQAYNREFDSECGARGQWSNSTFCSESQATTTVLLPWIHIQPAVTVSNGLSSALTTTRAASQTTVFVPSGFSSALNGSLIYKLDPYQADFVSARHMCDSFGSRMIQVKDNATMAFLQGLADSVQECLWIDGNKDTGTWLFSDGRPIEKFFWVYGEPNDKNGAEYCINIVEHGGVYGWNDIPCAFSSCYPVCQL